MLHHETTRSGATVDKSTVICMCRSPHANETVGGAVSVLVRNGAKAYVIAVVGAVPVFSVRLATASDKSTVACMIIMCDSNNSGE